MEKRGGLVLRPSFVPGSGSGKYNVSYVILLKVCAVDRVLFHLMVGERHSQRVSGIFHITSLLTALL